MTSRVREANALGLSIWYDTLDRGLLTSGELRAMVERDELGGVTSNPTSLAQAMTRGRDYQRSLHELAAMGASDARTLYERLALEDVRGAADPLRPCHQRSGGGDGYVSFAISPH